MNTKRIRLIGSVLLLTLLPLVTLIWYLSGADTVYAASLLIMDEYPGEGSTVGVGQPTEDIYASNTVTFTYGGGDVYVSSCPNTLCAWSVDDAMDLSIVHPDQSQDYQRFASYTQYLYGVEVTDMFEVGANSVTVELVDLLGHMRGMSNPLYLVEINTPPPPPDLDVIYTPDEMYFNYHPDVYYSRDPVNTLNGSFTYRHVDVEIPGLGPTPQFVRSYNSNDPSVGVLGPGWTHNYAIRLSYPTTSTLDVVVSGPHGRADLYTHNMDDSYSPPPGIYNTLVKNVDGTYTLTNMDQTTWDFNEVGDLLRITDEHGNRATLTYNQNGQLISVSDPAGRGNLTFSYNGSGYLTNVTDWISRTVIFGYDGNDRLTSVTDREGEATTYGYDGGSSHITTITDARGNVQVTNSYDGNGRVATQKDAQGLITGETTTFTYTIGGNGVQTTTITYPATSFDPNWDHVEQDIYNADGQITHHVVKPEATQSSWYTETYSYDGAGNRNSFTDGIGITTNYCFDVAYDGTSISNSHGNVTRIIQAAPAQSADRPVTLFKYDSSNNVIETISPNGVDSGTNVTCSTDLSNSIDTDFRVSYGYNVSQTLRISETVTFTDPDLGTLNAVTKYEYSDTNNPGALTAVIPPRGNTTATPDYTYAISYTYSSSGNTAGMLLSVDRPMTSTITYDHDAVGRMVEMVSPLGNDQGATASDYAWEYVYDNENRQTFVKAPPPESMGSQLVTEYQYDEVGNSIATIDANGQVTEYVYDDRNSLVEVHQSTDDWTNPTVTPTNEIVTEYAYDHIGNLVQVVRSANDEDYERVTEYTYDGLNRLHEQIVYTNWPTATEALSTSYVYDVNSNLVSKTDPLSQTIVYDYDDLNRLTLIDYEITATSFDVTYTYDANGNVLTMFNTVAEITYTYDELSRPITVVNATLPTTNTVGYRYDLTGNRRELIYPDQTAVTYTYDKADRLVTVEDWDSRVTTYAYNSDGSVDRLDNHNEVYTLYDYDNVGRLVEVQNMYGVDYFTVHAYTLDAVGNRIFVNEVLPDGSYAEPLDEDREATIEYEYDGIYRLVHEDRDWPGSSDDEEFAYVYDPVGNRIGQARFDPPSTYEITAVDYDQADRIVDAYGHYDAEYVVDDNGNVTTRDAGTFDDFDFTYDQENRLVFSNDGTTDDFAYFYDANGSRQFIGEVWPLDIVNWYVYDTQNSLPIVIQDIDNKYVIGLGLLYAVDDDDDAFFYHYDGSGSVVIVTEEDEDPRSRSRYQYNAYGETQDVDDFFEQPFMYAGQQNDSYDTSGMPNTGLYYMRARYYDPIVGRFMTRDPFKGDVQLPNTLNPYLYALGNPANLADPSGLYVATLCLGADGSNMNYAGMSGCLGFDGQGNVALVTNDQIGAGTGQTIGSGASLNLSGVNSIHDLAGQSYVIAASGGWLQRGSVEIDYSTDLDGNLRINSLNLGLDLGASQSVLVPAEVHWADSYTNVYQLFNFNDIPNSITRLAMSAVRHINAWLNPQKQDYIVDN